MTSPLYVDEEHGKPWADDEFLGEVEHQERLREDEHAVAEFRKRYEHALAIEARKAVWRSFKYSDDQERDDRGRFAGGGGGIGVEPELAAGLAAAAAGGGFSEQPFTGTEPTNGFMVAGISEPVVVHVGNTEEAAGAIMGFVDSHAADFERDPNLYIGGWLDADGMLVVELAENVSDRAEAAARGEERNQVAIYDVEGGQEIPTGGTGEYRGSDTDRQNLRAASVQLGDDDRGREAGVVPAARAEAQGRGRGEAQELKYSPDQERDEHGRFGSGGASDLEKEPLATQEQLLPGSDPFPGKNEGEVGKDKLEERMRSGDASQFKHDNVERISAQLRARMETDKGLAHNLQTLGRTDLFMRGASHYEHLGISKELATQAYKESVQRDLERGTSQYGAVATGSYPALEEIGARAFAANLQDSWAGSSTDQSVTSLGLQNAVGERFGAGDLAWMRETLDRPATEGPYSTQQMAEEHTGVKPEGVSTFGDQVNYVGQSPAMTAYAESVYRETQAQLKAAGITEVTLYRGMSNSGYSTGVPRFNPGDVATLNPLSSFTTDQKVASNFAGGAGQVLTVTVPAEHIFSTPMSGPGCKGEFEALVIGFPVTIEAVESANVHRALDETGATVYVDDLGNVVGTA